MSAKETLAQTFSASGEEAITRSVEVPSEETPPPDSSQFSAYYELERTVQRIEEGDYKRIALQFPDELLHDSVPVYSALQKRLGPQREAYVLADTSYGSCCVDEVAASHVEADVLVHYGHACLSQTSRLPVMYVFGRKSLDVEECVDKISSYLTANAGNLGGSNVLQLRHSVSFAYLSDDLVRLLRLAVGDRYQVECERLPEETLPAFVTRATSDQLDSTSSLAGTSSSPASDASPAGRKIIIWVGEESATLTKLLMTLAGIDIISYSPSYGTVQIQTHLTNKLLMRRYALLQKARDADVFGILIGTLGVASYLPLTKYLRDRLKKAHKKSYTVSVGKISPSKLANFMEIECWVWVACSEGMVDSKDYLRPIITPYELELALQPEPNWTGEYVFDFQELLEKATFDDHWEGKEDLDPDQPMFSLVSGKYRHAKRYGDTAQQDESSIKPAAGSRDLAIRTQNNALSKMADNAAANFLQSRSYQGLDPRLGQDAPSVLEQGRSGIARGYGDDHQGESAGVKS